MKQRLRVREAKADEVSDACLEDFNTLNGVPSLSILDGWWIEDCIEGETGWAIGELQENGNGNGDRSAHDAASLYDKLEHSVISLFDTNRDRFTDVMRRAISLNGSFFNTQRMIQPCVVKAYFE